MPNLTFGTGHTFIGTGHAGQVTLPLGPVPNGRNKTFFWFLMSRILDFYCESCDYLKDETLRFLGLFKDPKSVKNHEPWMIKELIKKKKKNGCLRTVIVRDSWRISVLHTKGQLGAFHINCLDMEERNLGSDPQICRESSGSNQSLRYFNIVVFKIILSITQHYCYAYIWYKTDKILELAKIL